MVAPRRFGGPFSKPCARDGCQGLVHAQWWSQFERRRFCSPACYRAVMLPKLREARMLAAAARRLPEPERRAYLRGYSAGWSVCDKRWRRHHARLAAARGLPVPTGRPRGRTRDADEAAP